jgi:catechol 2,3-dioxygenase
MTTDAPSTTAVPRLPATLRLGPVELSVADAGRSVAWYEHALGLHVHRHDDGRAELGDGLETLLVLVEDPEARPPGRHAGLYHYALLYPTREELARAAVRLSQTRTPIQGASDHRTHEAIYLADPDGNGIELAADRPREEWPADLGYAGGPAPLDGASLVEAVAGEPPRTHVGEGLRVGHLHLHVGDIAEGMGFYRDVVGFEPKADIGTAAFVSAGGYHHHLGFNVWRGRGVGPAPEHTAGLRRWTLQLPTDADVAELRGRLEGAGAPVDPVVGGLLTRDPWGTPLAAVSTQATGLRSQAVVATATPSRYLKQLSRHFAHKLEVRFDDQHGVIPLAAGHVQLDAEEGALRVRAFAQTASGLRRVEQVIGSHLERFGRRDGLRIEWGPAA